MIKALITDTQGPNRTLSSPITPEDITDTNEPSPSEHPIGDDMKRTTGRSFLHVHSMFKKLPRSCQCVLTVLIVLILIASLCALLLGGWFLGRYIKGKSLSISLLYHIVASLVYFSASFSTMHARKLAREKPHSDTNILYSNSFPTTPHILIARQ